MPPAPNSASRQTQIRWIPPPSHHLGASDEGLWLQAIGLVASSFDGPSYLATFPQVFGPQRSANLCALTLEGRVVAALAALSIPLRGPSSGNQGGSKKTDQSTLVFACIGSVCTDPRSRNQGFASELLRRACADLKASGHGGAGLFAAEQRMYAQCGFTPALPDLLIPLNPLIQVMDGGTENATPRSETEGAAEPCFGQPTLREAQTLSSMEIGRLGVMAQECWKTGSWSFSVPDPLFTITVKQTPMDILMLARKDGSLCGAMFYQKGADFQKTWHGLLVARDLVMHQDLLVKAASTLLRSAYQLRPGSQLLVDQVSLRLPAVERATGLLHGSRHSVFMTHSFLGAEPEPNSPDWSQFALPSLLSI